jgi:pyruvate-ferredoxin/flavodoxin oxidoreductase
VLKKTNPEAAAALMARSTELTTRRFDLYKKMAEMDYTKK